jgi:hypothetical protein
MQLCVEEINQCDGQTAGLDRDLLMFILDLSDWLCIQLAQFVFTDMHFRGRVRVRRWSVVGVFKNHQIESIGSWMNKCFEKSQNTADSMFTANMSPLVFSLPVEAVTRDSNPSHLRSGDWSRNTVRPVLNIRGPDFPNVLSIRVLPWRLLRPPTSTDSQRKYYVS